MLIMIIFYYILFKHILHIMINYKKMIVLFVYLINNVYNTLIVNILYVLNVV
jgi:hypothetical protein